ncbi:hypothetical protein CEXT_250851 [Caerostris extrusa]|uniref:Uncharacterized protein n=1 Tax=Caerostris extrusa TaxID=172846 RepID=A0AAV4TEZ6_CAEEX|nr:hypothetical protein CEXT_250851 [Caerostris extrusa]
MSTSIAVSSIPVRSSPNALALSSSCISNSTIHPLPEDARLSTGGGGEGAEGCGWGVKNIFGLKAPRREGKIRRRKETILALPPPPPFLSERPFFAMD